ncbi:MAG TPA: hypothetical protein VL172_21135 [Kofleriaceae bacterium]|nr:hypothetical protein [Kofleriaceae bacterium]
MRRVLAMAPLFALAGCLEKPVETPAQCENNDQCASGEVCDEGICWGNPPPGPFAAVLTPPAERTDLVATAIPLLDIASNGDIPDLVFSDTISVTGRVVIDCPDQLSPADCDPNHSVAAQIWVSRPSDIPGAPDYTRTVDATAGAADGDVAFSLLLPRLPADAVPYEVRVVPDDAAPIEGNLPPAAMAPPVRFSLAGDADAEGVDWVLGTPLDHKWVTGKIVDAAARGLGGMQVSALGRWTVDGAAERSSTLATTDAEGNFTLRIPLAMIDSYEIIARPPPDTVAPTLHAAELSIPDPDPDGVVDVGTLYMPGYPEPSQFVLPLLGTGSGGEEVPAAGAQVTLTTILDGGEGVTAVYTATGSSDVDGKAQVLLIPGGATNRIYLVQVRTDPTSEHASMAAAQVAVGPGSAGVGYLGGLLLQRRIAVSGTLLDDGGLPVANAEVLARPSASFAWQLDLTIQEFLGNLQPPATTTNDHGDFLLWLDPEVAGNPASYDLQFTPAPGTDAPPWTRYGDDSVTLDPTSLDDLLNGHRLGEIRLPQASFARGNVVTGDGETIAAATLWVLEIRSDDALCANAIRPVGDVCAPPAIPHGLWVSKDDGQVWIALPADP